MATKAPPHVEAVLETVGKRLEDLQELKGLRNVVDERFRSMGKQHDRMSSELEGVHKELKELNKKVSSLEGNATGKREILQVGLQVIAILSTMLLGLLNLMKQ